MWSCNSREQKLKDFRIQLIRAIVIDTVESPVIAFLCKFTNSSTADLYFGNRYYQETESFSGFLLFDSSLNNARVRLGSSLHSKHFMVRRGESRHLLFVISPISGDSTTRLFYTSAKNYYSSKHGNGWPFQLIENSTFKYISRVDQQGNKNVSHKSNDISYVDSTISIITNKIPVTYARDLLSEDAGRIVIELDSISNSTR